MKIVIDIPADDYKDLMNEEWISALNEYQLMIRNGKPLPKGHGDLISRNALKEEIEKNKEIGFDKNNEPCIEFMQIYQIKNLIDNAPTVAVDEKIETYKNAYRIMSDAFENEVRKNERPKGEWKMDSIGAYCSNCHAHPDYTTNFCSYCGADMRGEKK